MASIQQDDFYERLRHYIAQDDVTEALVRLQHLLKGSPRLDEAIIQSARHQDILKQIRSGSLDPQSANIVKNQIRSSLLELIRDLEMIEDAQSHTEIIDYKTIVAKIHTNRNATTSEILKNKSVDDLDPVALERFFEQERVIRIFDETRQDANTLTAHQRLVALSLAENGHIFKGTFLCLGQYNQIHNICYSAAESKFILFKGVARNEILVLETLTGNLIHQFEKMLLLLRIHIPLGRDRERNEDVYEIPQVAIREFIANAYVHRNYNHDVQSYIQVELFDDRLEIKSPGLLPQDIDPNSIEGTILVNPVVAAIFHLYKFMERAGTGIQVAQQALEEHGLEQARIENILHPKMVKVTIYRKRQPSPLEILQRREDEAAWALANSKNTAEGYEMYIKQGFTLHSQEALKRLDTLASNPPKPSFWEWLVPKSKK